MGMGSVTRCLAVLSMVGEVVLPAAQQAPAATVTARAESGPPVAQVEEARTAVAPSKQPTVSLNGLHGWAPELDNHLKIFDVAVDEARNRIYESSISVIDADTGRVERIVDLGAGGAQLAVLNRSTGKLYAPAMEYTDVVVFDTGTDSVSATVDIGNDVEDIYSLEGRTTTAPAEQPPALHPTGGP